MLANFKSLQLTNKILNNENLDKGFAAHYVKNLI